MPSGTGHVTIDQVYRPTGTSVRPELIFHRQADFHKPFLCLVGHSGVLGLLDLVSGQSQCLVVLGKSQGFLYPSAVISSTFVSHLTFCKTWEIFLSCYLSSWLSLLWISAKFFEVSEDVWNYLYFPWIIAPVLSHWNFPVKIHRSVSKSYLLCH